MGLDMAVRGRNRPPPMNPTLLQRCPPRRQGGAWWLSADASGGDIQGTVSQASRRFPKLISPWSHCCLVIGHMLPVAVGDVFPARVAQENRAAPLVDPGSGRVAHKDGPRRVCDVPFRVPILLAGDLLDNEEAGIVDPLVPPGRFLWQVDRSDDFAMGLPPVTKECRSGLFRKPSGIPPPKAAWLQEVHADLHEQMFGWHHRPPRLRAPT